MRVSMLGVLALIAAAGCGDSSDAVDGSLDGQARDGSIADSVADKATTPSDGVPLGDAPGASDGAHSNIVGPAGGLVVSADGKVELSIPAGALSKSVTFTIVATTKVPAGYVGTAYSVGPSGTTFAKPATLQIAYDPAKLGAVPAADLRVGAVSDGIWVGVDNSSVNTAGKTTSGDVRHLSNFANIRVKPVHRTCALSGDVAPNAGAGVTFKSFKHVSINGVGTVAFMTVLQGTGVTPSNHRALYVCPSSGPLQLVARTGTVAPGTNKKWVNFTQPMINNQGHVMIWASLEGTPAPDGLWVWVSGQKIKMVAVEEAAASPPLTGGEVWAVVGKSHPFGKSAGYFFAKLKGSGVTAANDNGLFKVVGGTLTVVARAGSMLSGVGSVHHVDQANVQTSNDQGATAFTINGGGGYTAKVVVTDKTSMTVVARQGKVATDALGAALSDGARYGREFEIGGLNPAGKVAFIGALTANDGQPIQANKGIWTNADGTLKLVARRRQDAPGTCSSPGTCDVFDNFSDVALNVTSAGVGHVVFRASLRDAPASEKNAIWATLGAGNTLRIVAQQGRPAGVARCPGAKFNNGFSAADARVVVNINNEIVFWSLLRDTCHGSKDNRGIFRFKDGRLEMLVLTTDNLQVEPKPARPRNLSSIGFLHFTDGSSQQRVVATGDGRRTAMNNSGEIAIHAVFRQPAGAQGVLVLKP